MAEILEDAFKYIGKYTFEVLRTKAAEALPGYLLKIRFAAVGLPFAQYTYEYVLTWQAAAIKYLFFCFESFSILTVKMNYLQWKWINTVVHCSYGGANIGSGGFLPPHNAIEAHDEIEDGGGIEVSLHSLIEAQDDWSL